MIFTTSNFDIRKILSPLYLLPKTNAVFKKQRASKVPIHLQDKINRLLEILEQLSHRYLKNHNPKETQSSTL